MNIYKLHNIKIKTSGTGLWSDIMKEVKLTKLSIDNEKDLKCQEIKIFFDTKTWNINIDGLIYTDYIFLNNLIKKLSIYDIENLDYSEQGAQGYDYIHLFADKFKKIKGLQT